MDDGGNGLHYLAQLPPVMLRESPELRNGVHKINEGMPPRYLLAISLWSVLLGSVRES